MKNRNKLLIKEAYRAYKNKRYNDSEALLEKIISITRDPYPYFLLCIILLLRNNFNGAEKIIKTLRNINPDYLPLLQLEAYLFLKSASDIHSVIAEYIDRLDRFPGDKYFKQALRTLQNVKNFSDFQKKARLKSFVRIPKPGPIIISNDSSFSYKKTADIKINSPIKPFHIMLFISILILASVSAAYYYFNIYIIKKENPKQYTEQPADSLKIDSINIDVLRYDLIDKIKTRKTPVFYYSNEEVINDFDKAKVSIKNKKYNEALIILNKLSNSNANYRVKERADFLRKFISGIEFRNYSSIPVREIMKAPYMYRGVCIEWNGKISNFKEKDNKLIFNLLVDYRRGDIFNGIIDVYSDKKNITQTIANGDIVSIKGTYINTIGENRVYLVADSIRKQ